MPLPAQAPDSSLVEDTLMAFLRNDAALKKLCPDGVWWDAGDEKAKRFIVVSLVNHSDGVVFEGRAFENYLFLVKAVMLSNAGTSVAKAAARIDVLLNNAVIPVDGFGELALGRESRVRATEQDAENSALRWLHRGGRYEGHAGIASA
jgi:hypothetical protein